MENSNKIVIELYDDNKQVTKYELLDIEIFDGKEYAIMMQEYTYDHEVEVFKLKHSKDKSATLYKPEKNDYIIMQVYEMFKEKCKKYNINTIKFEDE